jgi:deazaflavin-dependent oxidoreductase (nitroreductase family)
MVGSDPRGCTRLRATSGPQIACILAWGAARWKWNIGVIVSGSACEVGGGGLQCRNRRPVRRARIGALHEETAMAQYIPSPRDWVREQVELYERSGGTEGTTLRDTGLPVIIVTHTGNKTGAIRKTPLMRVKDGDAYVLVGSQGGAPRDPEWVYNLRANPMVELRDRTEVSTMKTREVTDPAERQRLWQLAVAAFPPYDDYQAKTSRHIPVFVAEPVRQ